MILDRYLLREIVPNVFLGLLVFTFVMLMNQIMLLAETLITKGVEFRYFFLIIFYSLPALTVLTIPMSLLLGILLALGRLSSDSELTVMRASGISMQRLLVPVIGFAMAAWLICSYLIQVSVPWGNYELSRMLFRVMTTNATSELKPRVFYNGFPNMVLYVQDIPTHGDLWKGVLIFDETQPDKGRLLLAKEGIIEEKAAQGQTELKLQEGSWHEVDPNVPQDYTYVYFRENAFPLPRPSQFSGEIPKNEREQTIPELKARVREYKQKKYPTEFLQVEIQKKYAIPFAAIVFSFLAMTLGISSKRGGRSSAYTVSIGIILVYYIFLIGGERFGDAGTISPFMAAWVGNIVLSVFGLILFFHTNTNASTKLLQLLRRLTSRKTYIPIDAYQLSRKRVRIVLRIERFPWRLFTLLDRYIVREFMKNFVLILIALVLIAELIEGTQLVDDLFRSKAGYGVLLQYLKFHLPQWVFYVLPVTALTTTLVTFSLFSKNSEIIAMKSSGISLYRISLPIIVVSILASLFAYWLQDYILPHTNKIAHNYRRAVKGLKPESYGGLERHWISSPDGFYNYEVFDVGKNMMYGFSIYQVDSDSFILNRRIYAREAVYQEKKGWQLLNGWERSFERGKVKYQTFKRMTASLPVNPDYFRTEQELPSEMTFGELTRYITKMKERGYDFVRFAVDLQAKLSFPTVSLILTLIAIPFSFTMGKRGALYGIGLSIIMGIVFWFFLALTKSLGYLEILNPFLAAWTPNILASLLALYMLFKLRT